MKNRIFAVILVISLLTIPVLFLNDKNVETTNDVIINDNIPTLIQPKSSAYEADKEVYYDIHYQLVENEKVDTISTANPIQNYIGTLNLINGRAVALKPNKIYVYNVSTSDVLNYTYSRIFTYTVVTTQFNFDFAVKDDTKSDDYIYIGGKMKDTTNRIMILKLEVNHTTLTLDTISTYIIGTPSWLTVTNTNIHTKFHDASNMIILGGFYTNSTSTKIPFLYNYNTVSNISSDIIDLENNHTFYQNFDSVILDVKYLSNEYHVMTDKHYCVFMNQSNVLTFLGRIELIDDVPYSTGFYYVTGSFYEIVYSTLYVTPSLISATYKIIGTNYYNNMSTLEFEEISSLTLLGIGDNYYGAFPDLTDGILVLGFDFDNGIKWNDWVASTNSIGGLFDWYIPFDFYSNPTTHRFELYYARSNQLWVARFINDDEAYFDIGNSKIDLVTTTDCSITHTKGTNKFTYFVSGKIDRTPTNSSEFIEVGVSPVYIKPGSHSSDNFLFNVDDIFSFNSSLTEHGVKIKTISVFSSICNDISDFYISFDSTFCPFIVNLASDIYLVDMEVSFVIYELYSNGTYTQKLMDTTILSKSFITNFNYELETQLVLQDSHLINEVHVSINDIEYDPYSLMFTEPRTKVEIRDKMTNDTLYLSTDVQFSDPLLVNIPSKYEFYLSYYSNVDRFGIDPIWVQTFVNGTKISTEYVRILSSNANIVVKDFSNEIIKDIVVTKENNGSYINVGLDLANVIINNNYNRTMDFYLEKGGIEIYYQIPSQTGITLRLAFGQYVYRVVELDGTVLIEANKTIGNSDTISFGFTEAVVLNWDDLPFTFVDTLVSIAAVGIAFLVVFLSWYLFLRRKYTKIINGTRKK